MCRRLASRASNWSPVEITSKFTNAKLTLILKIKVKFFRNHPNQPKPINTANELEPSNPHQPTRIKQPLLTNLNSFNPNELKPSDSNQLIQTKHPKA